MYELSKSIMRRISTPGFVSKFFVGEGIDIGAGPDSLAQYSEQFPYMTSLRLWDIEDGDAQYMRGIDDNQFDFVHSSHCLEHLNDPLEGIKNWFRIVKPGGHLVILIPDEDLYEQGIFPSTFNSTHIHTFTIYKPKSWSTKSINVFDLIKHLGEYTEVITIQLLNATFRYQLPRFDQTLSPIGECAIEIVIRKRLEEEVVKGGRYTTESVENV